MKSDWQNAVEESILSIQFAPYSLKGDGVSEDIYWNGKRLYRANDPPTSMCVGAVAEVLFKSLKKVGAESWLSYEQARSLRPYIFVFDEEHRGGVAAGLVELGIASWVDPYDVQFGDFAQINGIRFKNGDGRTPHYDDGHSVVLVGQEQKRGKAVLMNWSSSSVGETPGHIYDWHYIEKKRNGIDRRWYIARVLL